MRRVPLVHILRKRTRDLSPPIFPKISKEQLIRDISIEKMSRSILHPRHTAAINARTLSYHIISSSSFSPSVLDRSIVDSKGTGWHKCESKPFGRASEEVLKSKSYKVRVNQRQIPKSYFHFKLMPRKREHRRGHALSKSWPEKLRVLDVNLICSPELADA